MLRCDKVNIATQQSLPILTLWSTYKGRRDPWKARTPASRPSSRMPARSCRKPPRNRKPQPSTPSSASEAAFADAQAKWNEARDFGSEVVETLGHAGRTSFNGVTEFNGVLGRYGKDALTDTIEFGRQSLKATQRQGHRRTERRLHDAAQPGDVRLGERAQRDRAGQDGCRLVAARRDAAQGRREILGAGLGLTSIGSGKIAGHGAPSLNGGAPFAMCRRPT